MSTTNRQVAHIWAQGNGTEAHGSNFYCVSNRLYSYSTCVGVIHDGTAFLSSDSMTPTTGKQLSYAGRAVTGHYFQTPAFRYGRYHAPTPAECILAAAQAHADSFPALCRRRVRMTDAIERYIERREEILQHATRFDVSDLPDMPEATGDMQAKARQLAAQERERKAAATAEAERKAEAQRLIDAEQFTAWLTTGAGTCPRSYGHIRFSLTDTKTDYITIRGDQVITSQGAEAPLDHVIKALRFYDSRQNGIMVEADGTNAPRWTAYQTNGHKIPLGHFTLDSIDAVGNVRAGCHYFTAEEIVRFRQQWAEKLQEATA